MYSERISLPHSAVRQKIVASTLWQLASQGVAMILGIVSIKLVTAALSQRLVGNYQTAYSTLQLFAILADFGLYAIAVRELSRVKDAAREEVFGSILFLRFFITLLSLGSVILFAWVVPAFHGTPLPPAIAIAALTPFFTLLAGVFRALFQVHYRMHFVFFAEIFSKALPVLLMAAALVFGTHASDRTGSLFLFLLFGVAGACSLLLFSLWFSRGLPGVRPRFTWISIRSIFRMAAPYGLIFFLMMLYRQSDVLLIALLRPEDYDLQNAYYGIASRLIEVGFLFPTLLLNSVLPILSEGSEAGSDHAQLTGTVLLSLLVAGSTFALCAFFWSRPIILLLTNDTYLSTDLSFGADTALQLLSFSVFLSFLVSFGYYLLLATHHWRSLLESVTVAAGLSLGLNLLLIPRFGFVGAGMTSIGVHLLLALLLMLQTLRVFRVYLQFSRFVRWVFFSCFLGFLFWITAPFLSSPFRSVLFGVIILPVCGVLALLLRVLPLYSIDRRP